MNNSLKHSLSLFLKNQDNYYTKREKNVEYETVELVPENKKRFRTANKSKERIYKINKLYDDKTI